MNTVCAFLPGDQSRSGRIPIIMLFKNGEMVDMLNGAIPKAPFNEWLDESL